VFVRGGATSWINVTLAWRNGTVALAITPHAAQVVFNGTVVSLGTDGRANLTVRPGVYPVAVSASGFVSTSRTVNVPAGGSIPVVVDLLPVASSPSGSNGLLGEPILWVPLGIAALAVIALSVTAARRESRRSKAEAPPPAEPAEVSDVVPLDDVVP
jgi:hypothetical protein